MPSTHSIRPSTRIATSASLIASLSLCAAALAGCAQTKPPASMEQVDTHAVAQFQSCAKPEWPYEDLRAGHNGTVTLSFLVGADGTVRDSRVLKSSGYPALDDAARVGIMKCMFKPGTREGQTVESWTPIQYVWTHG